MRENLGKPYYGYRINTYIAGALIGGWNCRHSSGDHLHHTGAFHLAFGFMLGFWDNPAHLGCILSSFHGLDMQPRETENPKGQCPRLFNDYLGWQG